MLVSVGAILTAVGLPAQRKGAASPYLVRQVCSHVVALAKYNVCSGVSPRLIDVHCILLGGQLLFQPGDVCTLGGERG